ncbi:MAG: response regulator [Endomicrobiales bacterium]|nr:response regulator [Endomicrobiales bacterium]
MNKKIMVVDDDDGMVEYIKTGLELYGFKVVATTDGLQAVELAHIEKPDMIILDFVLPGIYGDSISKGLNASKITRDIPILFITGSMTPEYMKRISDAKKSGFMLKPFEMYNLKERIEKIFSQKAQEKQ